MGLAEVRAASAALGIDPAQAESGAGSAAQQTAEALAVGQGPLTVDPLMMARAWAASTGGALPPVRMIDAVAASDGGWQAWPAASQPEPAFSPATAQAVAEALSGEGAGSPSYSAAAVAGAEENRLAWYFAHSAGPESPVVVVVLEDAALQAAESAGEQVVRAVRRLGPP
jgi:hypothetical protein